MNRDPFAAFAFGGGSRESEQLDRLAALEDRLVCKLCRAAGASSQQINKLKGQEAQGGNITFSALQRYGFPCVLRCRRPVKAEHASDLFAGMLGSHVKCSKLLLRQAVDSLLDEVGVDTQVGIVVRYPDYAQDLIMCTFSTGTLATDQGRLVREFDGRVYVLENFDRWAEAMGPSITMFDREEEEHEDI